MTGELVAEKIKMADGHQENKQNSSIPDTNESASNDVDEAEEVNNIQYLSKDIYLLLTLNNLTFSLHIYMSLSYINYFLCTSPNFLGQDLQVDLDLGELDLTSQDEFILDEVDGK